MDYAGFERFAREVWETIPVAYKAGVDGLVIDASANLHPAHPDVYTLGECITEEFPSQYGGPDTTRSAVVLYYGSFRAIARDEDGFDWQAEIHETLMHELQHHLESLATEDALEDLDYAVDENFKRTQGEAFDPLFFRAGERIEPDVYAVEADVFFEVETRAKGSLGFEFEADEVRYRIDVPESAADVSYVAVENVPGVWIVRVRTRGAIATVRAAFGGGTSVAETSALAQVVE
jgi:hypothetical protein